MADGKAIYDGLIARGFSPVQAAVLAGNIQQESSFNPSITNDASGAKGLMQWRLDRLTALDDYAKSTGRSADDADTQLDFIVHEMQGSESKTSKDFLNARDVKTANDAIKKYIRYGKDEAGNRLSNALAFAPAPAVDTGGGFVNPVFGDQPASPKAAPSLAAPAPVAPAAAAPATPAAPAASSDDDLLKAFLPGAPKTAGSSSDDDLLKQFLPKTEKPPASTTDNQSSVPWLDPISAFASSLIEKIPVVGPAIMSGVNALDAATYGEKPEDRAAFNQRVEANQPVASTAGAITGEVVPYLLAGGTALGGKLLGTAGSMAERIAAGGLSSATIQGADTLARGGSLEDAGRNALIGGVTGGAVAPFLGGGLVGRMAAGATVGGGVTAAEGGSPEEIAKNAAIGAGVGGVAHGVAAVGNKLVSGVAPVVAKLAQVAQDKYKIPIEAAQMSANPLVKHAGDIVNKIPGLGGTAARAKQSEAFNAALANELGEPTATALTPDVMAAARDRIGNVFDSVATRVPVINADQQFQNEILKTVTDAESTLDAAKQAPILKQFENIANTFKNGNITGDQFLSLTAKNSILSKAVAQGGDVGMVAGEMKDALYGALERSAPADVVKDLQTARYQWKVMRTLENPAAKSPTGEISPAALMGVVVKNFGGKAFGQAGNMGELADIGQRLLKDPNSSQTAERAGTALFLDKVLRSPVALIGGLTAATQFPGALAAGATTVASVGGSMLLGRLAAAGMRSKALTNKLIANSLKTAPGKAATPLSIAGRAAASLAPGKIAIIHDPAIGGLPAGEGNGASVTILRPRQDGTGYIVQFPNGQVGSVGSNLLEAQ